MSEYIYSYDGEIKQGIEAYTRHEQIVRCRDCKHHTHTTWHRCDLHSIAHEVEPNGFCAWGERVGE